MDILLSLDGWQFLLRWLHFLAGITWIGMLYYFNFVQTPYFATELGGQARSAMVRGLLPNALWWFRWGAMFTFLSGWAIVFTKFYQGVPLASSYMTNVLTGGLMGTLMWFNVWFIIWPAQRVVIASAERVAGGGDADPAAAARGARAGLSSRTNTLLSIPMLFFMGAASHVAFLGDASLAYWLIAIAIIAAIELNSLLGPGLVSQKPLGSVSGTIHCGLAATLVLYVLRAVTG